MTNELTNPQRPADATTVDPLQSLLSDMRTNPEDARVLAQFIDTSVLVRIFREMKYDAEVRVRTLLEIVKSGKPGEKMKAIKMLDDIWDAALTRRGILTGRAAPVPAAIATPVGLPGAVKGFEATRVTETVRAVMDSVQPEKTKEIDREKELPQDADEFGRDAYYQAGGSTNPEIHRPPTVAHGQRTEIPGRDAGH